MVAWPSRVQMICSCPSCERALGHRLSACIALEEIPKIIWIIAGASSRIGMENDAFILQSPCLKLVDYESLVMRSFHNVVLKIYTYRRRL